MVEEAMAEEWMAEDIDRLHAAYIPVH